MSFSDELRRVLLAGIGAVATSAEKSKELVDAFVEKGELTVEQGKVLNEELKRDISDAINRHVTSNVTKPKEEKKAAAAEVFKQVEQLSPEELSALKKKLAEMENKQDEQGGQAGE